MRAACRLSARPLSHRPRTLERSNQLLWMVHLEICSLHVGLQAASCKLQVASLAQSLFWHRPFVGELAAGDASLRTRAELGYRLLVDNKSVVHKMWWILRDAQLHTHILSFLMLGNSMSPNRRVSIPPRPPSPARVPHLPVRAALAGISTIIARRTSPPDDTNECVPRERRWEAR